MKFNKTLIPLLFSFELFLILIGRLLLVTVDILYLYMMLLEKKLKNTLNKLNSKK